MQRQDMFNRFHVNKEGDVRTFKAFGHGAEFKACVFHFCGVAEESAHIAVEITEVGKNNLEVVELALKALQVANNYAGEAECVPNEQKFLNFS